MIDDEDKVKNEPKRASVVPISTEPSSRTERPKASLARLPAAVHRVREKSIQLLQQTLKNLFDGADDALYALAEKARSNTEQNIYFDAMREVRLQRREMERKFFESLDYALAGMLKREVEQEDEYASSLSFEELTLVDDEHLEYQVALEDMVNRTLRKHAEACQHIALRLDSQVPAKVYQDNNPLGPKVISDAFWGVVKPLPVDIKAKLVLLKLFDKAVMAQLGKIYTVVNQTFIQQHVLPSLATAGQVERKQRQAESVRITQASEESSQFFNQLRGLLSGASGSGTPQPTDVERAGNVAPVDSAAGFLRGEVSASNEPAFAAEELSQILTKIQQSPPSAASALLGPELLLNAIQQIAESKSSVSKVDQDVIHLITMLFQFVLDDRNLAAPMKGLLARLQIPMLKVAVVNKEFFSSSSHPARRLLNELASASLGWEPPEEGEKGGKGDRLYKKIEAVVQEVLADFETEESVFENQLTDFIAFTEKEARRTEVLERRTLDAEDGKARTEQAREQVSEQLHALMEGRRLPSSVKEILNGPWSNILFLTLMKEGVDSEAWQRDCQIVDDLIWSVTVPMDSEAKTQLMDLLPDLLQRLRQGFESISFNPFEMNRMLQQLEKDHLNRMRVANRPFVEQSDDASAAETAAGFEDNELELPRQSEEEQNNEAKEQEEDIQISASALEQVGKISQGTWFEVEEPGRPLFRCRLAAIINSVDKFIFVNRSGMKVSEKSRVQLAQAMQSGYFKALDDGQLFDRALESVIGNLRQARGRLA